MPNTDRETTIIQSQLGEAYGDKVVIIKADDVSVSGFTFSGYTSTETKSGTTSWSIYAWGDYGNLTVSNNIFTFYTQGGIRFGGGVDGAVISDNIFQRETRSVWYDPAGVESGSYVDRTYGGMGPELWGCTNATIDTNTMETYAVGISIQGCDGVSIEGNTVSASDTTTSSDSGIQIQSSKNISVTGNTVSNFTAGYKASYNTGTTGAGIRILSSNENVTIESNELHDNTLGVLVTGASGSGSPEIHRNNIEDNEVFGVLNCASWVGAEGTYTPASVSISATCNWWGHESGPYHDPENLDGKGNVVSDNVNFTPWLIFKNTLPIISTDPADGDKGIGVDTPIKVTFAETIVEDMYNVVVEAPWGKVSTTSSCKDNVLTITPEGRWAYDTTYEVTISSSSAKSSGSPLDTYTFFFTTRSKPSGGAPAPEPTPTPPSAVEPVSDSVVNNAIEEAEKTGQVTIEVNKEETALTIEQLEQIADTDKPAVIKTEEVEFVLPPEVVAGLAETDAAQIEITAEKVAANEAPAPPSGFQLAGEVFELTIVAVDEEGNKDEISGFTKAITITLPVPASAKDAAVAGKLDVYRYNETTKTWEAMGGTYDAATNTISFSTLHLSKYALMERTTLPTKTFADIKGHWAQSDIEIMAGLGIVGGISENEFAPQMPVTGLVGGYEDGTFKPEKEISRQEIAALIARALKNEGEEVIVDDVDSILARFKDASKISPWAKEEAARAVTSGIIGGRDGLFAPKDSTKRAEAVVMLKRMLVKLGAI